ncbi:MAG: M23 family metallopeptidase [Rectinema sp.]
MALLLAIAFAFAGKVGAQVLLAPDTLSPGDPLVAWLASPVPVANAEARLTDSAGIALARANSFEKPSPDGGFLYGMLLAVPRGANAAPLRLEVTGTGRGGIPIAETKSIALIRRSFPSEDIPLDAANSALRTQADPVKTAQSLAFAEVFAARDPGALFLESTMIRPLGVWRITAGFGDRRRYLYSGGGSDTTVHGGLDLGAALGTPVMACGPGRVVFVGDRIVTGTTIVIEHLPGLFSIYMHLSRSSVRVGDRVAAADLIGAVGSTGLSTGPHLHWELRIGDVSVDPEYWLFIPPLDKKILAGTMSRLIEGR